MNVLDISPASFPDGYVGTTYMTGIYGQGFGIDWNLTITSGALPPGISFVALTGRPNEANAFYLQGTPTQAGAYNFTMEAVDSTGLPVDRSFTLYISRPYLSISKAHTGNFTQGQTGAVYTVVVSNAAGSTPTTGVVTVTEAVPAGMTLVSMVGSGWNCAPGGITCTRTDALNGGFSYPPITVSVNVAPDAVSPQVNQVSVSGGGSANAGTTGDSTTIVPQSPLANLSSPAAGTILPASVTFQWTAGQGASAYWLDVGTFQ